MYKFILALLTIFSFAANAKLAPTTLDSLVGESEIVVEGAPMKLERLADGTGGIATLKVYRVWMGTYEPKEIRVTWSSETHDQPIEDLGKDYLLFLKKDKNGSFTGAHHGRSYWSFAGGRITDPAKADLDNDQRHFSFEHPTSLVTLTEAQKKILFMKKERGDKSPRISVKALREYIAQKKKP